MKTSIVIPNWNGAEKLKSNLPAILSARGVEEVIIVDDASTDGSVEVVEKQFSQIKLIKKAKNSGFSTAVNIGVKAVSGDLVAILNSDAAPQADFISNTLNHFQDPKVFSVGCNVGGAWAAGEFRNGFFWHSQAKADKEELKKPHQTLWASGGSGIFRKSIWEEIGSLDELFDPFYEEDVDLGYRATKRGYINVWEPSSVVEHYREKGVIESNFSKSFVSSVAQRNQLFFIWKNIHDPQMIAEHKITLIKMLLTRPKYWPVFLSAISKFSQVMAKREIEKKSSKLTDQEVLALWKPIQP